MRFSFPCISLVGLPPFFRRFQLIAIDAILLLCCMAELLVALGAPISSQLHDFWDLVVYCCESCWPALYAFTGQYKGLTLCGECCLPIVCP